MQITFTHTRADGTLVEGTRKGDGAGAILRRCGFRPSRHLPGDAYWYLPHSRDKRAKRWEIDQAAEALRTAGFVVAVKIEDLSPGRSFAAAETERYERAEDRAARFGEYADNAARRSEAADRRYRQWADNWPPGQPLISDRARASHKRAMAAFERSVREGSKAAHWTERADTAERYQKRRENIGTTLRRIDKLEAERRGIERALRGREEVVQDENGPIPYAGQRWRRVTIPPDEDAAARMKADLAALDDELAYWRDLIRQAEERGVKLWRPADFTKGDFARCRGSWYEVLRVNPKTLTVPAIIDARPVVTAADSPYSWTDRIPYDNISGRKSGEAMSGLLRRKEP